MTTKFYLASLGLVAAAFISAPNADAQRSAEREDPIYEVDGTTIRFSKVSSFIDAYMGYETKSTTKNSEIVFDGKDVYFFNMTASPGDGFEGGDTYIHGVLENNRITVEMPQLNNITDGNNTEVKNYLSLLVEGGTVPPIAEVMGWTTWFEPAEGTSQVTFDIDAEGVISLALEEKQAIADCAVPSAGSDPWVIAFQSMKFEPNPGQDLSCYLEPVGVDSVVSDREMVAERFFDLNGNAVVAPAKGTVCVRVIEYSDGTSESIKTVVR